MSNLIRVQYFYFVFPVPAEPAVKISEGYRDPEALIFAEWDALVSILSRYFQSKCVHLFFLPYPTRMLTSL